MKRLIVGCMLCVCMAGSARAMSTECKTRPLNLAACVWSIIYDMFIPADSDGLSG